MGRTTFGIRAIRAPFGREIYRHLSYHTLHCNSRNQLLMGTFTEYVAITRMMEMKYLRTNNLMARNRNAGLTGNYGWWRA